MSAAFVFGVQIFPADCFRSLRRYCGAGGERPGRRVTALAPVDGFPADGKLQLAEVRLWSAAQQVESGAGPL